VGDGFDDSFTVKSRLLCPRPLSLCMLMDRRGAHRTSVWTLCAREYIGSHGRME
jgi:hypothetical protein